MHERFADLTAEEAIAWGRARAAIVLIRTGDSSCYFSAGERNPDPERYPVWPPADLRLERRRPRGFEALDNSESDPPVPWDVRVTAEVSGEPEAHAFHETIRSHPAAHRVQAPAPGCPALSAAFLVEASTHRQGREIADRILKEALAALLEALPESTVASWVCEAGVYPHRAGKAPMDPMCPRDCM